MWNIVVIFGLICIVCRGCFLGNIVIYIEDNLNEMFWYLIFELWFREEVFFWKRRFYFNNYVDVVLIYDLDRGGELLFGLWYGLWNDFYII